MTLQTHSFASVRERREFMGLKAVELANRLGVQLATWYRYERGDARPFFDQALAVAKMLNCPVERLAEPLSLDERVDLFRAAQLVNGDNKPNEPEAEPVPTPTPQSEDEELQELLTAWGTDKDDKGIDE